MQIKYFAGSEIEFHNPFDATLAMPPSISDVHRQLGNVAGGGDVTDQVMVPVLPDSIHGHWSQLGHGHSHQPVTQLLTYLVLICPSETVFYLLSI